MLNRYQHCSHTGASTYRSICFHLNRHERKIYVRSPDISKMLPHKSHNTPNKPNVNIVHYHQHTHQHPEPTQYRPGLIEMMSSYPSQNQNWHEFQPIQTPYYYEWTHSINCQCMALQSLSSFFLYISFIQSHSFKHFSLCNRTNRLLLPYWSWRKKIYDEKYAQFPSLS
jgi:hypothetical protein